MLESEQAILYKLLVIVGDWDMLQGEITQRIIRAFYDVYNELGYGFLERVYENALVVELKRSGLSVEQQFRVHVYYDSVCVGWYRTDLVVQNCVIVEVKAGEGFREEHECQLTNYLRATEYEVGLLINFGRQPQFKRKLFTNDLKGKLSERQKSPY